MVPLRAPQLHPLPLNPPPRYPIPALPPSTFALAPTAPADWTLSLGLAPSNKNSLLASSAFPAQFSDLVVKKGKQTKHQIGYNYQNLAKRERQRLSLGAHRSGKASKASLPSSTSFYDALVATSHLRNFGSAPNLQQISPLDALRSRRKASYLFSGPTASSRLAGSKSSSTDSNGPRQSESNSNSNSNSGYTASGSHSSSAPSNNHPYAAPGPILKTPRLVNHPYATYPAASKLSTGDTPDSFGVKKELRVKRSASMGGLGRSPTLGPPKAKQRSASTQSFSPHDWEYQVGVHSASLH